MTEPMQVQVLLFAGLAERAGTRKQTLDLARGARARDAWAALAAKVPGLQQLLPSTRIARNGRLVSLDEGLSDGDELAFLPPVGGG
ncbi:MAG: MoaD/ThiS family protein [Candidatus Eremiobacteraeota bacterium]|nr:MoaD/ThiS family protein [Candidatus Eremiobacteraeota bacterium]